MQHSVDTIFSHVFPKHNKNFEIRKEQIVLAQHIHNAMQDGRLLAAEAGTGTGKSFAYLVPAILHALEGKQVVIVTATINLQHQLIDKDIPYVQEVLGTDIPVSILKGKNNYLCASRLTKLLHSEEASLFKENNTQEEFINMLKEWAATTETGDKENISQEIGTDMYIPQSLWSHVCTHEFACGGAICAARKMKGCFFQHSRRKVFKSGIIITNYNILSYHFIHMQQMMQGDSSEDLLEREGLLPHGAVFILDEAHRIKNIIRDSMKNSFSLSVAKNMYDMMFGKNGSVEVERNISSFSASFENVITRCRSTMQNAIKSIEDIQELLNPIFVSLSPASDKTEHRKYTDCTNDAILDLFFSLSQDTATIAETLTDLVEIDTEKKGLATELQKATVWWHEKSILCKDFSNKEDSLDRIKFISYNHEKKEYTFFGIPLSVSGFLSQTLFEDAHAVIATSATMTTQKKFNFWTRQVGFPTDGETIMVPSPFDYKKNVQLGVLQDAPEPNSETYLEYLAEHIPPLCSASRGRALILCTSKLMVLELADRLYEYTQQHNTEWEVLAQDGTLSSVAVSKQFKTHPNAVLVATDSFWEGFDAPDDMLRLLVITRIPFVSPENLLFKEEKMYLEQKSINWFSQLALPIAEIKLRQGFGRLMRNSQDGGTVLISDSRIIHKSYGSLLLAQLPECKYVVDDGKNIVEHVHNHLKKFL